MVLVVMFLCDQSYASHGRDFLLGATILNPSARASNVQLLVLHGLDFDVSIVVASSLSRPHLANDDAHAFNYN